MADVLAAVLNQRAPLCWLAKGITTVNQFIYITELLFWDKTQQVTVCGGDTNRDIKNADLPVGFPDMF